MTKCRYKRIVLKLSGEFLAGNDGFGINIDNINYVCQEIKSIFKLKVQIGIVVGGGNICRGSELKKTGVAQVTGDDIGMLATVINSLVIRDVFERNGMPTKAVSALEIEEIVEKYNRMNVDKYLHDGFIVIMSGGTGNPLVTTDSALSLRGIEQNADLLIKATNVDGVYSDDPKKNKKAKKFTHLTYKEAIQKELKVMDIATFVQCRDNKANIMVFNIKKPGSLLKVVLGKNEGTLITC